MSRRSGAAVWPKLVPIRLATILIILGSSQERFPMTVLRRSWLHVWPAHKLNISGDGVNSPGSGLYTRGFSLCYRFWHLFWLLDTLGIKNPLGGISAIVALLTKMAAEITAPAKSVKILKITIYWPSMACNTSKFLFWWVEFISNEKRIIWIDWGT